MENRVIVGTVVVISIRLLGQSTLPVCLVALLVGCNPNPDLPGQAPEPPSGFDRRDEERRERFGTIQGSDGFTLFATGSPDRPPQESIGGVGVNAFLWRATLDTIDFLPLVSADAFGGLIITDWHSLPETPGERYKIQVQIRDARLRADGVRATVFRQVKEGDDWVDVPVDPATGVEIEDKILTRARQLRITSAENRP